MSETYKQLIENLPPYERDAKVINEIMHSSAVEIEKIENKTKESNNELFLDSATTSLSLHERDLNIVNHGMMSIERRRAIVQGRYKAVLQQTTEEALKASIQSFSPAMVEIDQSEVKGIYDIKFTSENGLPQDTVSMMETIDETIPAHLDYNLQYIMIGRTSKTTASVVSSMGEIVTIFPKSN